MLETLRGILLDFQEALLDTGVPRRVRFESVPGKAMVCIGVRRSGKSTYMYQRIQHLLDRGVSRKNILYLNFFDDRLHDLKHEKLAVVAEAYYSLYPEKKNTETVYCFFDEIQAVPGWEPFIDRMMRTEKCEVFLTGSSARMLSREIATQMRGRALSWEMFPFSFREFLDARGISVDEALSNKSRLIVQKAFDAYWETGGFPEVTDLDERVRIKIHQEYLNAILFRDLIERHDIAHPQAVSDLAHRLIDNTASLYSVNRLWGYLKSLGHSAPRAAVSRYVEWFEDAYFLFSVRLYDASLSRSNANPKKIYCIDHALVASVSSGILTNAGHLLENLVFTALRREHPEVFYCKTGGGREVDFIVPVCGRGPLLVQVCESLADPNTRKRELAALEEAMAEHRAGEGTVVTRRDEEVIETDCGRIAVVPAWKFLLGLGERGE